MSQRSRRLVGATLGAVTLCLLLSCAPVPVPGRAAVAEDGRHPRAGSGPPAYPVSPVPEMPLLPLGAFLGSDEEGVRRLSAMERWLGGTDIRVGHTYVPGDRWSDIEGRPEFLRPWADWRLGDDDRMFVLNVPMMERDEAHLPDSEVRGLLQRAAAGAFDGHFRTLARHLVDLDVPDTVITLGWEMNGTTYTHRCGPDPRAWKAYWRRIVTAMRSVPGQEFRFDFAPARGANAIGWTKCYPGDDVVDIIGMETYDRPAGETFDAMVHQPYGLQAQVDFADAHGKEISYPEWGLFDNGDNPEFVTRMLEWIAEHRPLYQSITDYCPHGVWRCQENPRSTRAFRAALYGLTEDTPPPERDRWDSCGPSDSGNGVIRRAGRVPELHRHLAPLACQVFSRARTPRSDVSRSRARPAAGARPCVCAAYSRHAGAAAPVPAQEPSSSTSQKSGTLPPSALSTGSGR
ncbi:glycoside hydrolase family 26 protein [Streptomyces halobius]|uniref:Glycosyl hydrolase family 26 n=1 Tax=Streptomyces halobius TaxID=2879846 RepID=A0ABY4MC16_9ACTN|nr:glycosyl hydrolase [Streptomyces halobius]UQA95277.1 glycosyl hydrolase family 26 [Streptomyces halobius]